MNAFAKAANSLWSLVCLSMAGFAFGLFIFWAFIQQPFIQVSPGSGSKQYTVTAGSLLYVENPVVPAEFVSQINYSGVLVKDQVTRYALAAPDIASRIAAAQGAEVETVLQTDVAAAPLYAIFIPSYVQPGTYRYVVTATYRLNPFRTSVLELPQLTIIVE